MAVFPVVMGTRLRATKINSCGLPIAGKANRLVTSGFVTATLSPQMKDANELEQENAEGRVCVSERTPPERKYYQASVELCNVNTGLISMFTGWEQVLDHKDNSVGYRDQKEIEADYGVALEIWTGGKADDDCPTPESDDIFSNPSSGKEYGYLLFGATEFTVSDDLEIGAQVSTMTLQGITTAIPQWGRGPYNVASIDDEGTPGRLLVPTNNKSHYTFFRTPVAPPETTKGSEPEELQIAELFGKNDNDYYFGGPNGDSSADVAPDQPDADGNDDSSGDGGSDGGNG